MANDGFYCYRIYCSVIAHFTNKKFDVTDSLIPRNKLVNAWNEKRFDTDGKLFQALADKYKPSQLLKMFAIYYYHYQEHPHPSKLLNDNFEVWQSVSHDFKFPLETYKTDLYKLKVYCVEHKVKLKEVLHSNKLFSLRLKMPTLVVLNSLFDITLNLTSDNLLESKLVKRRKLYLDKLTKIFYPTLDKHDWKSITKQELKNK